LSATFTALVAEIADAEPDVPRHTLMITMYQANPSGSVHSGRPRCVSATFSSDEPTAGAGTGPPPDRPERGIDARQRPD
jgi:hypothetical protein